MPRSGPRLGPGPHTVHSPRRAPSLGALLIWCAVCGTGRGRLAPTFLWLPVPACRVTVGDHVSVWAQVGLLNGFGSAVADGSTEVDQTKGVAVVASHHTEHENFDTTAGGQTDGDATAAVGRDEDGHRIEIQNANLVAGVGRQGLGGYVEGGAEGVHGQYHRDHQHEGETRTTLLAHTAHARNSNGALGGAVVAEGEAESAVIANPGGIEVRAQTHVLSEDDLLRMHLCL